MDNHSPDKPYTNREIREKWHEMGNTLQEIKLTQDKASKDFIAHQEDDHQQHLKVNQQLDEMLVLLKPIAEVYKTVETMGRWSKIGLGSLLLILSIAIAVKTLWLK